MSQQIKKKFIADGTVDGDKFELIDGQALKHRKSNGSIVEIVEVNDSGQIEIGSEFNLTKTSGTSGGFVKVDVLASDFSNISGVNIDVNISGKDVSGLTQGDSVRVSTINQFGNYEASVLGSISTIDEKR